MTTDANDTCSNKGGEIKTYGPRTVNYITNESSNANGCFLGSLYGSKGYLYAYKKSGKYVTKN